MNDDTRTEEEKIEKLITDIQSKVNDLHKLIKETDVDYANIPVVKIRIYYPDTDC
jgi:hypothetical protein